MSFFDRMKKVIGEGFDTTRELLGTAAEKAKDLGEKGVLKYEINRLERDTEKKFAKLGNVVYELLVEKTQATVSKSNSDIKSVLTEITELEKRINEKEEALKQIP